MKIVVISDTHIPERAKEIPQEMLDVIKGADMVIHAGDLVDVSVLDQLNSACSNVKAVWGNMDPLAVRKKLPEKELILVDGHKIGVMHGFGPPDRLVDTLGEAFKNDNVDVIIFGHSHQDLNKKKGNILFFNPGSLTDTVFSKYNSFGIIEINEKNGKIKASIVKL